MPISSKSSSWASKDEIIRLPSTVRDREVLRGGPMQRGRGFVLHSPDYFREGNSYVVNDEICLTATLDMLKAMAFEQHAGRCACLRSAIAAGRPGQLENEIALNGWLTVPFSRDLLFGTPLEQRYDMALEPARHHPRHAQRRRRPRLALG